MKRRRIQLTRVSEEELLRTRICDLPVRLAGTPVAKRVQQLYGELRARGIKFEPHVWLADEWFSPDGTPGIAIPFYLSHPRLIKLQTKIMLDAEGAGEQECMRILRHEAGHAIATAYRLHRRKEWREHFGAYSTPYPSTYKPRPGSKSYVQHLNDWYAQAHPAEDFAETFAVWLTPRSRWRTTYRGWRALKKLQCVDRLMRSIAGTPALNDSRETPLEIRTLKRTLSRHYALQRARYLPRYPRFLDRHLKQIFVDTVRYPEHPSAVFAIRQLRTRVRGEVSALTGVPPYTVDQFIDDALERSKQLKLRRKDSLAAVRRDLVIMLTGYTLKFVHSGEYRVRM